VAEHPPADREGLPLSSQETAQGAVAVADPGAGAAAGLRIGTRGSALALAQANFVRDALVAAGVSASLTTITTAGDRRAPDTAWGEGAFVSAIEAALLAGEVDVAVHSAKDVPTDEDPRLAIAAYVERAPAGDVVVLPAGRHATSLAELPKGSRVGTDSPRRTAFLLAARPDLRMHPLHGNVDTRLRRLDAGETDAIVLAEAGLTRLGRADRIGFRLDPEVVPPAPGQGALAIQVRADDARAREVVGRLDDPATRLAVEAERALLAASGGGCRAPIGALGRVVGNRIELLGGYARPDGSVAVTARRVGDADGGGSQGLVEDLLDDLARAAVDAARDTPAPRLIVTRAADQAAALQLALVDRGLAPLSVPAIAVEPEVEELGSALTRLPDFDWVVVTSSNAARALALVAGAADVALGGRPGTRGPRWAAVGLATARALRAAGIAIAFRPERSSGAALAAALPLELGARILLPRSDIADEGLVAALEGRSASVESVVAYRTVEAPAASLALLAIALRESPRAIILTSGSTARGVLGLAARLEELEGLRAVAAVRALPAICIGSETATEARRLGFPIAAEAAMQGVAGLADAAARYLIPNEEVG
jgi:hydroxymethylbilane synthase